jgi:hypothetical protein
MSFRHPQRVAVACRSPSSTRRTSWHSTSTTRPATTTSTPRPLTGENVSKIGQWNNGLNCSRWVKVTIGDFCTRVNDGAQNQAFCRNGSWVSDAYNGATLMMQVADNCGDSNAWCRDDPYTSTWPRTR